MQTIGCVAKNCHYTFRFVSCWQVFRILSQSDWAVNLWRSSHIVNMLLYYSFSLTVTSSLYHSVLELQVMKSCLYLLCTGILRQWVAAYKVHHSNPYCLVSIWSLHHCLNKHFIYYILTYILTLALGSRFCDIHSLSRMTEEWGPVVISHCWYLGLQYSVVLLVWMNAAIHVVSDTQQYDRGLSHFLHDELYWLDVPQRVQYKLCATVHRCLQHRAPQHMTDCCIHTSDIARRHLPGGRQHRTTVHDGLLHPHLRHCSSPASAVRWLPSAVHTATPAFSVRSLDLFYRRPGGTRYQTTCEIHHVSLTVFTGSWKLFFSHLLLLFSWLAVLDYW